MVSVTLSGAVLGLAAGLLPGPLLALVLHQTLRHGAGAGVRVAAAPLLTDPPIVAAALFSLDWVAGADAGLGAISLLGAGFLAYLAYDSVAIGPPTGGRPAGTPRSLQQGIAANLFNPHPYLFWFTVGAPIVRRAWTTNPLHAAGFVVALYGCLVGSKTVVALLAARGRGVLTSRAYALIARSLGLALAGFSLLALRDGLRYLGVVSPL